MKERLSICYAAPGHSLVPTAGTTRNILSLAKALSERADVTVAFRSVPKGVDPTGPFQVETIEATEDSGESLDDEATRGVNPFAHLVYLRKVRRYARETAGRFDFVLEKGWRLSGYLVHHTAVVGVPGAVVENDARCWTGPRTGVRDSLKWCLHSAAQGLASRYSRTAPVIIAETEELKKQLHRVRRIPSEKIEVVPLGVDHQLFRPGGQAEAREKLRMDPARLVFLYVGGMDKYHDLSPLLEALAALAPPNFELHLVGEGEYRPRYEEAALRSQCPIKFHGKVRHEQVPLFIAASDLCLAPYCSQAFYDQEITFSTLKIPEYMACARPVAGTASAGIQRLIHPGINGFLLANRTDSWRAFISEVPDRQELGRMGEAARRAVQHISWEQTASGYLQAISNHGLLTVDNELEHENTAAQRTSFALRRFGR
ncbi:MAG TPA: glycosyltransferase [Acidobacteriota bacterium]|nr:glycosyltransferase [Acidobacteriota bacterium]